MITLLSAPPSRHGPVTASMIALDDAQVARLQRADVDHHVDLAGAVEDCPPRLVPLHVGVVAPSGKPTTEQTLTGVPDRSRAASATQLGLTQTVANLNCAASRHSSSMFARVASA
jgi:hypothetical protein